MTKPIGEPNELAVAFYSRRMLPLRHDPRVAPKPPAPRRPLIRWKIGRAHV